MNLVLLAFAGLVAYVAVTMRRQADSGDAAATDVPSGSMSGILADLPDLSMPDPVGYATAMYNIATERPANVSTDVADRNVAAFLAMLRASEGTAKMPDPYRVVMGYGTTLQDLSDHPFFTGEWKGATFGKNGDTSTAAGAYQFLRKTWASLRDRLNLPDFGPASQDAAAIELIRERGALEDVKAGRFDAAVNKVRRIWASLPGAGYGQPERRLADLRSIYQQEGGAVA